MPKVDDNQENFAKCVCPNCPTYTECTREKGEKLFCGRGESACPLVEKGCICGTCPVWDKYGLEKGYFCLHGVAM
ncbi:MAG TPA: DUF2769 domain-containing protein [Candidatus Bathyarchaeia archaeon]|nr:DUF2769 domain-containing protein [Candidatus Bathyarchaeia archaeon]